MTNKNETRVEPEIETPYPTQAHIDRVKQGLPAEDADEADEASAKVPKLQKAESKEMTAGNAAYANRQMTKTD